MKAFASTCGWIGFQSGNRHFIDGPPPQPHENIGLLLSAECYNSVENASLHIRQDSVGGWLLTRFEMSAGESSFFDTVKFVACDATLQRLRYRRYWRVDDEHGAEPFAACFIGFGEE